MDPYVYPGTNVLRNRRDIRDPDRLGTFEEQATNFRLRQLEHKPLAGAFDTRHLQGIHHHIFQDLYTWAGEFRTVDLSKAGSLFGLVQHIDPSLNRTFAELQIERHLNGAGLKRFSSRAAYYLGEINAIHPFREAMAARNANSSANWLSTMDTASTGPACRASR
jgi:cell filamentation protein